jgi:hypothetical protein
MAELCAGITITAERLRRVTPAFAARARWSPAANSTSWRCDALASAITSHASELILRALAERAAQLGADPAVRPRAGGRGRCQRSGLRGMARCHPPLGRHQHRHPCREGRLAGGC